jgi:hypothetical protein
MKPMLFVLATILATACTTSEGDEAPLLSRDIYYLAVFAPHPSPEACLANSPEPRGCRFAITLCKDGRAAERIADIIQTGTYEMSGATALVSLPETTFEFDVATRVKAGDSANTTWILDTNDVHANPSFDTIDCAD